MDLPQGRQFPKLHEVEEAHMLKALIEAKGNMTMAAQLLGIGRATMYRRCPSIKLHAKEIANAVKAKNVR